MDHRDSRIVNKPADSGNVSAYPAGNRIVERGLHQAVLGIEMASTAAVLGIIAIAGLVAMILGLCLAIPRFVVHWLVGAVHKEANINSPLTPVPGPNGLCGTDGPAGQGAGVKEPLPVWPYSLLSSVSMHLIPPRQVLSFAGILSRRENAPKPLSGSGTDRGGKSQLKREQRKYAPSADRAGRRANASPGLIPS